jgi:uncharacterized protein with FMN-binding domain
MKKFLLPIFCVLLVAVLSACQQKETEITTETPVVDTCPSCVPCETCEVNPQYSFFETMDFAPAGFTPGYRYFLAGTLNASGVITQIHFDMVSTASISKRSRDYQMNVSYITVGGTLGNQTLEIFLGGSTANIPQAMNTIRGAILADGSNLIKSLPLLTFTGAPVNPTTVPVAELYQLLSTGIPGLEIDDETTVYDVLSKVGLWNAATSSVRNGRTVIGLTGRWGGGTFHQQLVALENYIVQNNFTLVELYHFLSTTNQIDDTTRDTVAGATMMFEPKILAIVAQAAGIDLWDGTPTVIESVSVNGNYEVTVRVKGYHEMRVKVVFNSLKTITSIVVLSHTETPSIGGPVLTGTFINEIINNQNNLTELTLVAGATMTSQGLIDAVVKAKAHIA